MCLNASCLSFSIFKVLYCNHSCSLTNIIIHNLLVKKSCLTDSKNESATTNIKLLRNKEIKRISCHSPVHSNCNGSLERELDSFCLWKTLRTRDSFFSPSSLLKRLRSIKTKVWCFVFLIFVLLPLISLMFVPSFLETGAEIVASLT